MKGLHLRSSCLRLINVVGALCISLSCIAQVTITVVEEGDINTPLAGVQIHNDDYSITGVTDLYGRWTTPTDMDLLDSLTFSYLGYTTKTLSLADISAKYVYLDKGVSLEEVTIVGRTDELASEMIHRVETISQHEILQLQTPTTADVIGQQADVYIQKSQAGGGSPVIRGFEANKVLLVIDGIRMNNAIYRSGHLQNAITIDPSMLAGVEIIYGPGSLVYGSDALGGVIHFRSRQPLRSHDLDRPVSSITQATVSYASANQKKGVHLDYNIGGSKWGSLTSLSYHDFGNLRAGTHRPDQYPLFGERSWYVDRRDGTDVILPNENPDVQLGTAYKQYDVTQKVSYDLNPNLELLANMQYSTSSDIPRYDALIEISDGVPQYAEWNYGPQERWLTSIQSKWKRANPLFDAQKVILAYQRIGEDRITRRYQSVNREIREEKVDILTLTLDMSKYLDKAQNFELNYGLEYNHNEVTSQAKRVNIESGSATEDIFTRYPSGLSTTDVLGAYVRSTYKIHKATRLIGGMRYTSNAFEVRYDRSDMIDWPESFYEGLSSRNQAFTWSIGWRQDLPKGWQWQCLAGSAFRSPNIDDLAKIRINNDEVSVPNLNLTPEQSYNAEITLSKRWPRYQLGATAFSTQLRDAIVRRDFTFEGREYLIDEGDSLRVVANVNANAARVYGLSFNAKAIISDHWRASGSINYIQGRIKSGGAYQEPLAHIPPTYGRVQLEYIQSEYQIEARYVFNGRKPLDEYGDSTDNPELTTADGSYAWSTLNLYSSYSPYEQWQLRVGLENILDHHYRPFASGVSGAGRNILVSIQYRLE